MKRYVAFLMAVLLLAFAMAACGSESKEQEEYDSDLFGYWISEKQVIITEEKTEEKTEFAGVTGIEFYENGMIRHMIRKTDEKSGLYYYDEESDYVDEYLIIGKGQIAMLGNNSGEKYIATVMEYKVEGDVLTLVTYAPGTTTMVTYNRLDTPFYKYFPEASAEDLRSDEDPSISTDYDEYE